MGTLYYLLAFFYCILAGLYSASFFESSSAGWLVFCLAMVILTSTQCIVLTIESLNKSPDS